jgi:hypothetical protein
MSKPSAAAPATPSGIFDKLDGEEVKSAGYWKPVSAGQVLLGEVEGFAVKMFPGGKGKPPQESHSVVMKRVVTFGPDGTLDGSAMRLKAPLNSTLVEKITPDLIGKSVALLYAGDADTPAGLMRVFRVKLIDAARHLAAWKSADAEGVVTDDDDDDGLPF